MGIYHNKAKNRWILEEQVDGKRKQIGSFKTRQEAEKAKSDLTATTATHKGEFIYDDRKPQVEMGWFSKAIDGVAKWLKRS